MRRPIYTRTNFKMDKGGMATGKRNKEGRKRRKEQERVEYLDHQKRRLENYIKAEVSLYIGLSQDL